MAQKIICIRDWDAFCKTVLNSSFDSWVKYVSDKSELKDMPTLTEEEIIAFLPIERVEELAFDKTIRDGDVRIITFGNLQKLLMEASAQLAQGIMDSMIKSGDAEYGVTEDGELGLIFR